MTLSGQAAVRMSGQTAVRLSGQTAVTLSGRAAVRMSGQTAVKLSGQTAVGLRGETDGRNFIFLPKRSWLQGFISPPQPVSGDTAIHATHC